MRALTEHRVVGVPKCTQSGNFQTLQSKIWLPGKVEGKQESPHRAQSDNTTMLSFRHRGKMCLYILLWFTGSLWCFFALYNFVGSCMYPESWHKKGFLKYSETVYIDFILITNFRFVFVFTKISLNFLRVRHDKPEDGCNSLLILKHLHGV